MIHQVIRADLVSVGAKGHAVVTQDRRVVGIFQSWSEAQAKAKELEPASAKKSRRQRVTRVDVRGGVYSAVANRIDGYDRDDLGLSPDY